jgi:hypothetical protein
MATSLERIQTLLQPDVFAKVKTLAKRDNRTMSATAARLIQEALKLDHNREALEAALAEGSHVKPSPDERVRGESLPWGATKGEREGPTYSELFAQLASDETKAAKLAKLLELL